MADYAIGDVQGCYDALQRLLEKIHFDDKHDRLWFVGDLVNRGTQSLEVLRFVKSLPIKPYISLGNHDLYLLKRMYVNPDFKEAEDTLEKVLKASDSEELGFWLRNQSLICYSKELNIVMTHAGIAPVWNLSLALTLGGEVESTLTGPLFIDFLKHMYGNEPSIWSPDLKGMARLRLIVNYFTRMRFCNVLGALNLSFKGDLNNIPKDLYPWFSTPNRINLDADLVFGHWAALNGVCSHPRTHAIDTGYFWGGSLTALRLQDKERFLIKNTHSKI